MIIHLEVKLILMIILLEVIQIIITITMIIHLEVI